MELKEPVLVLTPPAYHKTQHPDQTVLTDDLGQGSQGILQLKSVYENEKKNDSTCTRACVCNSENTLTTLTEPIRYFVVRILQHVGPITGSDGREYDLQAGEVVTLPEDNARALIDRHAAVELRTWEKPIHIRDPDMEEMG